MSKKPDKNLIVGLDIGTSKVVAIVGEITPESTLDIIGIGSHPSIGLKKGVVVNIESTVHSIQRAIEEAELMAGCQIHSVYTGIAGQHIRSLNSHGIVAIRDHEVTQADVDRVIDAAKAVPIPADQKILHILPQQFIIDTQDGIKEPVGMSGVRLEAKVHMVTGSVSAAQNIIKCVRRCGLEVDDIILEQLASSYSVLTEDEKELGVCLVDIGGGTSDIAVISLGGTVVSASIKIAGDDFDEALVRYMRKKHNLLIGERTAEDIKIKIGSAYKRAEVDYMDVRGRNLVTGLPKTITVSSEETEEALREATSQIIETIHSVLEKTPPELAADIADRGIVLTGGGSLLRGLEDLIAEKTGINTMTAEDPMTAVAIGTGKYVEFLAGYKED